jgi:curli biogenesis system outer membrane secretion channel CsgG
VNNSFSQKKVVAISPFEVPDDMKYRYDFNGTGLIEKIPTLLESELFNTGLYDLVERAQLDVLIDEQTLSYAGMTDKEYDFGALKGVDYFLLGKISGFSAENDNVKVKVGPRNMYVNNQTVSITLTIRLVDVETGKLISVITEEGVITAKGRPRGNQKNSVSKSNIDKAAKKVVSKVVETMVSLTQG